MSAETGVVAEDFPEDELSPKFVDWLVDKILDFTNLLAGHNLHPYQTPFARRIIRSVVVGDGDVITAMASRQALPVDTPLLTPRGWTTMGEVQVGDEVYAPDGTSTRVHDVSPVFTDSQCFRVEFSDGRSIVADGPHRWLVYDRLNKKERTLTTDEIARDFRGSGDRFSYRYCVRVAHPVDLPEADLPLDPYLLGCWLGDGSSSKAEITTADEEIVWAFRNAGYESSYEYPSGKSVTYGFRRLYPILREEGLVKNSRRGLEGRKHVPQEYLLGSVKQRLALLQGLMDTDGHITSHAEVEFCSTTKTLAESVLFLARSLGWKAALKTGRATLNGKDCGVKYRVCWTPYAGDLEPFRLPRKVSRLREAPVKEFRARRTTSANIVGVTPVDSVPTRCIAVAHPSEMFLAGPDLIPTKNSGKTETVADVVSALMIILPRLAPIYPELLGKFAGGFLVGMFAPVETQAETLFSRCVARLTSQRAVDILGDPEIDDETGRTPTKTRGIRLKNSGSEMLMMTANPRAKIESKTFHLVVIDECQEADDFVITKSISPMLAYSSGTMVLTGTPTRTKGYFYKTIQLNKRLSTSSRGKKNHYEWNWKDVAKINKDYGRYIKKEMLRIGEDSDEFQMSYCVAPETRILTADLRYIRADEVVPGMKLVGFDEERPGKGKHRRLQETTVLDTGRITRPAYRLEFSDGTVVTSSSEHRWLTHTAGGRTEWTTTEDLSVGFDRIAKVADVWEHTEDYRTGYLAAAFDGEGHFSRHSMLGFSQRENAMYFKVRKYLEELNFDVWTPRTHTGSNADVTVMHIGGGRSELMRFLGQVRPERLLDKVCIEQFGTLGRHARPTEGFQHPVLVSKEFVGETEVIPIKTTTKTYIAEGLASHNCCRWMLDRGMFITETAFEELADVSMQTVKSWHSSPVIVGIDPARKQDSTVVTVVWVDWDHPDEFGHLDCRILNWLEIQGDDWEAQYYQIVEFLANYDVLAVGVDANGVGDAVAQRLKLLLPRAEVVGITSSQAEQSRRYKHLQTLIQRGMIGWPSHAKTRRLKTYQRFMQQMLDAEKQYTNQYFTVAAPDEAGAHDDYVDSLSIACYMTADLVMPTVQESTSPFFS